MAHGKKTVRSGGRRLRRICGGLLLLFVLPVACNVMSRGHVTSRWQDASHDPTGQAPDPSVTPEAVLQVMPPAPSVGAELSASTAGLP